MQSLFEEWSLEVEPLNKMKRKSSRMEECHGEVCPYCQKTYQDEETLVIHIKIKHQENEAFNSEKAEERYKESIFESESDD